MRFFQTSKDHIGFGRGLPFYWLVALCGFGLTATASGYYGLTLRGLILGGLGSIVGLLSLVGWSYAEEHLPLPALPLLITLCGLATIGFPFVYNTPTDLSGLATILAGILITLIPIAVENRRWQLMGLPRR